MSQNCISIARLGAVALAVSFAITACAEQQTTEPTVTGVELAKGGSGGGPGPKVDEADPPSAPQDTTLDVRVLGSGFDDRSTVSFTLDGVATDSVRTNSTRFKTPKELVANITIAVDAVIDLYDVEVMSGPGKKGIGADLFAVVEKGSTGAPWLQQDLETIVELSDQGEVRSDGRDAYVGGDCGVYAKIFSPADGNGSGDAVMDPDWDRIKRKDRGRCGDERAITIVYSNPADGGDPLPTETFGTFQNIEDVWSLQVNDPTDRFAQFNAPSCNILRFDAEGTPGTDNVEVTRIDDTSWHVTTKAFPYNRAWCQSKDRFFHISFSETITIKP